MKNLKLHDDLADSEGIDRASQEELYWTMELSAQIPWTSDANGRIMRFGHKWVDLTGLANEDQTGDSWAQSVHQEDQMRVAEAWRAALDSGEPFDIEHRIRTSASTFCWMRSRAFPRFDEAGQVVKWYGTTEDISARKRIEDALRQSQKLAAVAQLASSISHEINNPLEAVTNLLYLAQNPEADLDTLLDTLPGEIPTGDYLDPKYVEKILSRMSDLQLQAAPRKVDNHPYSTLVDADVAAQCSHWGTVFGTKTYLRFARYMHVRDFQNGNFVIVGNRHFNPWTSLFEPRLNYYMEENISSHVLHFRNRSPRQGESSIYEIESKEAEVKWVTLISQFFRTYPGPERYCC